MKRSCPYCLPEINLSDSRIRVVCSGRFRRKSDARWIQRYKCLSCKRYFSNATSHPAVRQKKRHKNHPLYLLLCSGVSLRRSAKLLHLSRTTVARKLIYLGAQAQSRLQSEVHLYPPVDIVEFDDQETFEHSKCKPLSITLAVESKTRRILGFEVARMPAKGKLSHIARKKYGRRPDQRPCARRKLFHQLQSQVKPNAIFKSDENPHYPKDLKRYFPKATHQRFKGQRGSIVGQGELKKIRFDPLFSLNHTCAMTRANINRLFRKTWCTTKSPRRLRDHFAIYVTFHNQLIQDST